MTAALLVLAGCGGGGGTSDQPTSTSDTLKDAIRAPKARLLHPGDAVTVSRRTLARTGFQVSCVTNGQRANFETIPGQQMTVGRVIAYPDGGPVVEVKALAGGHFRVSCSSS